MKASSIFANVLIRPHFAQAAEIDWLNAANDPFSADEISSYLGHPKHFGRALVAAAERPIAVLGFALFRRAKDCIWLDRLSVHPSCWRRGIGTMLTDSIKAKMSSRHSIIYCRIPRTDIYPDADAAAFLESQDFELASFDQADFTFGFAGLHNE